MQKRKAHLGDIFVALGLISPADVERALAHQREVGGYFGDALIHLGLLSPEQLRWGLADQYDVPFVRIRPEHIDRAVALRIPAAWAREHLILPVLRDGETITVILADPARVDRLDEVRRFTGAARVEAALSTPGTVRELIDSVHGEGNSVPVSFAEWIAEALVAGATAVGVSGRGERARGWSRNGITATRALQPGWQTELDRMVAPAPTVAGGTWPAVLRSGGMTWVADCHQIGDGQTREWMAQLHSLLPASFPRIPVDAAVRERLAGRPGEHRLTLRVTDTDEVEPAVLDVLLATLPPTLWGAECRFAHLADRATPHAPDTLHLTTGPDLAETLHKIQPFGLDLLSLDLRELSQSDLEQASAAVPAVLFRAPADFPADFGLCLRARAGELFWTLHSPADATD